MMRGLNIAREIRAMVPSSEILFYAKSQAAATLCDNDFQYFVEKDLKNYSYWPKVIQSFSPDVIVCDTVIPKRISGEPYSDSIKYVFVMRKGLEHKQQEIFRHRLLRRADLIVIPHTEDEFGYELPPWLRKKSRFVGPIIRVLNERIQEKLRKKYRISKDVFLVISTIGGGGFDRADSFFEKVFDVHRRIYPIMPNLRHIVVQGPNYGKFLEPLAGMDISVIEEELINLFALSDIVVAEGGYNTVNEIRLTRTPAIFLPGGRSNDDQEERVRALEKMGLASVFSEGERIDIIGRDASRIITSAAALKGMRDRYKDDYLITGNRMAAEHIVKLVAG